MTKQTEEGFLEVDAVEEDFFRICEILVTPNEPSHLTSGNLGNYKPVVVTFELSPTSLPPLEDGQERK